MEFKALRDIPGLSRGIAYWLHEDKQSPWFQLHTQMRSVRRAPSLQKGSLMGHPQTALWQAAFHRADKLILNLLFVWRQRELAAQLIGWKIQFSCGMGYNRTSQSHTVQVHKIKPVLPQNNRNTTCAQTWAKCTSACSRPQKCQREKPAVPRTQMKTEDYLYWGISSQASADPKCAVTARKSFLQLGSKALEGTSRIGPVLLLELAV